MQHGKYESPVIQLEERAKRRRYKYLSIKALKIKRKQFPRSMRRYVLK